MGADNWTICPKCKAKQVADEIQQQKDIAAAYGKVSMAIYTDMQNKSLPKLRETLGEDYEIYMEDTGLLIIKYLCHCDRCGFEFSHSQNIGALT